MTEYDEQLDLIDATIAKLRVDVESELASHSNTKMLLETAMVTLNVERARADQAERLVASMRKEHNS